MKLSISAAHPLATGKLALAAAAALLPLSSFAANWIGSDGNFADSANWDSAAVPANTSTDANITNGSTVTINSDLASFQYFNIYNGSTVEQTAGSYTLSKRFTLGIQQSAGTYLLSGGSVTFGNGVRIGYDRNSTGTMVLSNNASVTATANNVYIGATENDSYTNAEGILTLKDSSSFTATTTYFGYKGISTGTLNIQDSATYTTNSMVLGYRYDSTSTAMSGTVNLDGGTLVAGQISKGAGNATFNANGGTLKAKGNQADFLKNLEINLLAGGLTIDTQGYTVFNANMITNTSTMTGVGGLTKIGTGTLTLNQAQTYTGATKVEAGTLAIGGSIASAQVHVANGATLELNNASALLDTVTVYLEDGATLFLGADSGEIITFNELFVNGTQVAAGTYADNDPIWNEILTNDNVEIYANSNVTLVIVIPEPSTYALMGGVGLLGMTLLRRRRKN